MLINLMHSYIDSPLLRVHVAPVGFEVDRIVEPALEMKADVVYLLIHNKPGEDKGLKFREQIKQKLAEFRIVIKEVDANRTDLFDTLGALSSIIMTEKNNAIYVNVSVGSKIQAIASMLACMMFKEKGFFIKPYYAVPLEYKTPEEQETTGLAKIIDLPEYKIETPKDNLIRCMNIIQKNGGKITKKELKNRAVGSGLIHVAKKDGQNEPSPQAPFMALNKNLIEPLLEWQFVTVEKVGSSHVVKLTQSGIHALRFLKERIE